MHGLNIPKIVRRAEAQEAPNNATIPGVASDYEGGKGKGKGKGKIPQEVPGKFPG